jgi:hypothetical protein
LPELAQPLAATVASPRSLRDVDGTAAASPTNYRASNFVGRTVVMTDASRRNFLALAGAGAAVVGAAAVAPAAAAAAAPKKEANETELPAGADQPMVAYVKNPKTGELAVMAGEREVVVRDRELVARLARKLS